MENLSAFISVLAFMLMGFIARRLKLLDEKVIRIAYKFLFTLPLPIVVLVSLGNTQADTSLLALPVIGALVAVSLVSIGYLFTVLFGLSELERGVVLIAAIAPTGALTIPFCSEHDLDVEYASALVVLPMAISVFATFVLLAFN